MKKQFSSIVFASALLIAAPVAFAGSYGDAPEPEEGPAPVPVAPAAVEPPPTSYWYVGAAALYSIENFQCNADDAWGYNVRVGRRLNDYFAVEGEWEHPADNFDDASRLDGYNRRWGNVEAFNATINARFYPTSGVFQPYALIGAGYGQADLPHDDNDGFISRFGLGFEVEVIDNFGFSAEGGYVLGTGGMSKYDQIPISVGVFYNFL